MSRWKRVPTFRLEAIINDPYTRGVNGKDYEQYRQEIQEELYERYNRNLQKELDEVMENQDYYENNVIFTLHDESVIIWLLLNFKKLESEKYFSKK